MWIKILIYLIEPLIKIGHLEVEFPGGEVRTFGDPNDKKVRVTIKDSKTLRSLVLNPDLALGESYMDNSIIIENDDLYGLLSFFWSWLLHTRANLCKAMGHVSSSCNQKESRATGRITDSQFKECALLVFFCVALDGFIDGGLERGV